MNIIFMIIAFLGVLINIFARKISAKYGRGENSLLKIKLFALFLVLTGVTLLMISGK